MRTKFRMLLLSAWCLAAFTLSGCWDRIEVNDLAITRAVAIDQGPNDLLEMTVLVVVPTQGGIGGSMSGTEGATKAPTEQQQVVVQSAKGRTLAEALSFLQLQFPRRLFWGHTEVILIGEELARHDIRSQFDYILRHPQLRIRSRVFVTKGRAKDVLFVEPLMERDIAESLKEGAVINEALDVTTKEFAQMLIGESNAAILPYVNMMSTPAGGNMSQTVVYIDGAAIFKNGKLVGTLDQKETRGALWLRNEMKRATITIKPGEHEDYISMFLLRSETRLKPNISGDQWQIRLRGDLDLDVYENATDLEITPEITRKIEQATSAEVERRVEEVLAKAQKEMNADVFGFAEAFHRAYPSIWRKNKDKWDEIFPKVQVTFDIQAKVKRPGLIHQPALLPRDEIHKNMEGPEHGHRTSSGQKR